MHPAAKAGFQDAEKYDQARPGYSKESVDAVIELGGLLNSRPEAADRQLCILELGAGTGKFTEIFLECCNKDVRFVAIDPNTVFLEKLRQKHLPIAIMSCMANNIKLATESVDISRKLRTQFTSNFIIRKDAAIYEDFHRFGVIQTKMSRSGSGSNHCGVEFCEAEGFIVAAQSFHWFADRESLVEIHRVMKKGAKFVVLWNAPGSSLPWLRTIHEFCKSTYKRMNTPIPTSYEWKESFQDSLDLFTPLELSVCISTVKFTLQEYLSFFTSLSVFAGQSGTEKEASEKEFLEIVRAIPDFQDNCLLEIPWHTEIYLVSKI